jgi:hypothetical protein
LFGTEAVSAEVGTALITAARASIGVVQAAATKEAGGGEAFAVVVNPREALVESSIDIIKEFCGAIDDEMDSLLRKHKTLAVASIKDLSPGDELLPSLIVLTRKSSGRAKARLVACGNFQTSLSSETFASVVAHESWMLLLVTCLVHGGRMAMLDISTAFLQSEPWKFARKTFLRQPSCFKHYNPDNLAKDSVFEVLRSVYGLSTAPKAWRDTLVKAGSRVQNRKKRPRKRRLPQKDPAKKIDLKGRASLTEYY